MLSGVRQPEMKPACVFCPLQAYVFNGDIYYMASVSSRPLRLTSSDQEGRVSNGLSDWTYEGGTRWRFTRSCQQPRHADSFSSSPNRGGAPDVRGPLVVCGRGPAGVPHHQQLPHAAGGNTPLPGWSLSHQHGLPLPKGESDPLVTCFSPLVCPTGLFLPNLTKKTRYHFCRFHFIHLQPSLKTSPPKQRNHIWRLLVFCVLLC